MRDYEFRSEMINDDGLIIQDGTAYSKIVDKKTEHGMRCQWGYSSYCGKPTVVFETYTPASDLMRARLTYSQFCDHHAPMFAALDKPKDEEKIEAPAKRKSAHADCQHEASKSARAACRQARKSS